MSEGSNHKSFRPPEGNLTCVEVSAQDVSKAQPSYASCRRLELDRAIIASPTTIPGLDDRTERAKNRELERGDRENKLIKQTIEESNYATAYRWPTNLRNKTYFEVELLEKNLEDVA